MVMRPQPVRSDTLEEAARRLRAGGLVALPTETVYGLGADALNVQAVARVFEVKGRPRFDPLIVHVADAEAARGLCAAWPDAAARLAEAFWPGPLTLVLPRRGHVPDLVTAGLETVAVRVPGHAVARRLLELAGCAVAAPSANRFGGISPTSAADVAAELGELLDSERDMLLDGGRCERGVESTVLSLARDGQAVLLRPGATEVEAIERVIGPVEVAAGEACGEAGQGKAGEGGRGLASPGMMQRHYAPRTPLRLAADVEQARRLMDAMRTQKPGIRVAGLSFDVLIEHEAAAAWERLSAKGDLREAATGLFAAMRRLDGLGLDAIVAVRVPDTGLGRAINDRLRRASTR